MYGLIHRAIKDCVIAAHGEGPWHRIAARAGVDEAKFVSMQSYPDDIAYGLVGASCDELGVEPAELLRAFGHHWVMETARKHYGPIMDFGGSDLKTFLANLDRMHEQVALSFANLDQPSFELEDQADGSHLLHYRTHREGLADFVIGLVEGLGEYFRQGVEITPVDTRDDGADHDVFRVVIRE